MGDYVNAITYYGKALEIEPSNNTVRENLGRMYIDLEMYDRARTAFLIVVKSDPEAWDAMYELAKVCIKLGETDDAEVYLETLLERNPGYKSEEVAQLLMTLD